MHPVPPGGWGEEKGQRGRERNSCSMAARAGALCCGCGGFTHALGDQRMPLRGRGRPSSLTDRRLSVWRGQNGVSISSLRWLSTTWVLFGFFPLPINAVGLPEERHKPVTKPVVPEVSS